MNRRQAVAFIASASVLPLFPLAAQQQVNLKILTPSQGTVNHLIGNALASVLSKSVPGYSVTAATVTPPSTITQVKEVGRGAADITFASNAIVLDADRGQGDFRDGRVGLKVLLVQWPTHMHLLTFEGLGIAKLADIKGKRVSTGAAGGAVEVVALRIVEAAGLDADKDIKREKLVQADAIKALQEGRIDAFFQNGPVGVQAFKDLAATPGKKLKLIDIGDTVEAINRKYGPIYSKGVIPARTYAGQDVDATTSADWNLLLATDRMSEQVAYNVVKTFFERQADLVAAVPGAALMTMTNPAGVKLPVAFHPGALKYFAEKGIRVAN